MAKGCKWAERTDEYHGWKCPVTIENMMSLEILFPDSVEENEDTE